MQIVVAGSAFGIDSRKKANAAFAKHHPYMKAPYIHKYVLDLNETAILRVLPDVAIFKKSKNSKNHQNEKNQKSKF